MDLIIMVIFVFWKNWYYQPLCQSIKMEILNNFVVQIDIV